MSARISLILVTALMLAACASSPPAPVEERTVETMTRAPGPAVREKDGVQVRPLQNPAVVELTTAAAEAERAGDLDQAAIMLERAMRIQPRDPQLLQHMAEIQLQKREYEQALGFAVRSYDIGPRVGEICVRNWRTIGQAREYMSDSSGAEDAERRAQDCIRTRPQGL